MPTLLVLQKADYSLQSSVSTEGVMNVEASIARWIQTIHKYVKKKVYLKNYLSRLTDFTGKPLSTRFYGLVLAVVTDTCYAFLDWFEEDPWRSGSSQKTSPLWRNLKHIFWRKLFLFLIVKQNKHPDPQLLECVTMNYLPTYFLRNISNIS